MTLRVKIEIVPFGDEDKVRTIRTVNISNIGTRYEGTDICRYGVEVDKYKTNTYDFFVEHSRAKGAEALAAQVLELIE